MSKGLLIQFRLNDDLTEKLWAIMETLELPKVKNSDNMRKFIEALYFHLVNPKNKQEFLSNIQRKPDSETIADISPLTEFTSKAYSDLEEQGMWCPYGTYMKENDQVYCDNPRKKKQLGKDRLIPVIACYQCNQRKQYVRRKRMESNPTPKGKEPQGYACSYKQGQVFKDIKNLPCITDVNLNCGNPKCHAEVLRRIGFSSK